LIPDDLKYTKEHEWVRVEGDVATVGITAYAAGELGDVVYVELPGEGDAVEQMKPFGTIEAVKTVAELFSPLSGEVAQVNEALEDAPETINGDPFGEGWFVKIKISDASELDALLSPEDYGELIGE
jgi:glycine cleavage system H protein